MAASRKVVVFGAGAVGAIYAYALLQTGWAGEIVLIDIDAKRVEGEIMDLSHGLPFVPPVFIRAGDPSDCAGAHLVVVTAGAKQSPGQSRSQLIKKNAAMVRAICSEITRRPSEAVLLMVTNPVDALTQLALDHLGWPRERVIGSGTVLDSARFRFMLSQHCGIDAGNVHAYILGEHGDSEVAAWSMAHIAGIPIAEYCRICRVCDYQQSHALIAERVRDSAYHIIDYKGSTYYGIGLSLIRISGAILRKENSVLTVSTLLKGEYGIQDVCLSAPCIVGENGVVRVIDGRLSQEEHEALVQSAEKIAHMVDLARSYDVLYVAQFSIWLRIVNRTDMLQRAAGADLRFLFPAFHSTPAHRLFYRESMTSSFVFDFADLSISPMSSFASVTQNVPVSG